MNQDLFRDVAQSLCLESSLVDVGWQAVLESFWTSQQGQALQRFLAERQEAGATIYPPNPYRALELTPLANVRVVILGQDPYHGPAQAHGLAFSVPQGVKLPPSLRNIYKELGKSSIDGNLEGWARQGVLLLNTCLTVEDGQPASHAKRGWEVLTDSLIKAVSHELDAVVFMLWGAHAQAKQALIDAKKHLVLMANHPSPLSALRPPQPFIGCGHFVAANKWLGQRGFMPINW